MHPPILIASTAPEGGGALRVGAGRPPVFGFKGLAPVISAACESRRYPGIHREPDGVWGRYPGTLAAIRTHEQLLASPDNPTRVGVILPGVESAEGLMTRWPGIARPLRKQFAATGQTGPFAPPGLEAAPWPGRC